MKIKERLEELHKFYINGIINVDDLVEELVKLEQLNWVLINQNKRYRKAIEKAMSEMETLERYGNENAIAAYVTLKEALEGEE